jgi:pimeloyl-ACP methyl ester carboxylesterase
VLVDTGAPLDSGDKIKRMPPWPRMLFWIARNVPQALMLQYRYGAADFFRGPDRQKRAVHFYFRDSPADMQLVQDPVYAEIVRRNVAYCLEDPDQLSRDFAFWAQDRSHLARKILETTPIVFLHGAENRWFPVCDVEDFCKAHDRATVRIVEGESYFLIYRRPELLASCLLE